MILAIISQLNWARDAKWGNAGGVAAAAWLRRDVSPAYAFYDMEESRSAYRSGNFRKAQEMLEGIARIPLSEEEKLNFLDLRIVTMAMQGFLHRRLGQPEQAEQVWRSALALCPPRVEIQPQSTELLLAAFILRSVLHTWTPESAQEAVAGILGNAQNASVRTSVLVRAIPAQTLTSVLAKFLDNPRGLEWSERFVFHATSGPDAVVTPVALVCEEFIRQTAYDEVTPADEQFVHTLVTELLPQYRLGEFSDAQVVQFLVVWKGAANRLAWSLFRQGLKPAQRAEVACLLGRRAFHVKRPDDARALWNEVLAENETAPAVRTLAEKSLKLLDPLVDQQ